VRRKDFFQGGDKTGKMLLNPLESKKISLLLKISLENVIFQNPEGVKTPLCPRSDAHG